MHRRFPSHPSPPSARRQNARRRKVRKLTFDSLEDRRLLAGLNVFVYDDADGSGLWESSTEGPLAEQVVYVDHNADGRLDADEPYGIAGADGKAFLDNLASGIAMLRILGSTSPATTVSLGSSSSPGSITLAGNSFTKNTAPVLRNLSTQSADEDNSILLSRALLDSVSSDADNDPLWFFIIGRPSNGTLMWSVEAGGSYQPQDNFYGTDSAQIRAFDGKAWSPQVTLDLAINSVDDLPTTIEFAGGSIPENQVGFILGPITVIDIDGGPNSIRVTPEEVYAVQDGTLKLQSGVHLNYEESSLSNVTIHVTVGTAETPILSRAFSMPVEDRNDAPTALEFQGQPRVEEFIAGFEFGSFQVIDEDLADRYSFLVNDNRFEVVDGKLALKAGEYLVFADAPSVLLTITAIAETSGDRVSDNLSIEVVRAAPPWQNKNWALDVNNDGELTPQDVLTVINALNRMGVIPLDRLPPSGSSVLVDVNGDRFLTPLDALILINALNRQSRGSSEGGSRSPNGGEGEGHVSTPPAFAIDDENLSPPHIRKTARRVR